MKVTLKEEGGDSMNMMGKREGEKEEAKERASKKARAKKAARKRIEVDVSSGEEE
mgnify:CR=1 FL=1